jgi:hypothetical protein
VSSIHPTHGTLSGKPFAGEISGRLHGDHNTPRSGQLHGGHESPKSGPLHGVRQSRGTVGGESAESPANSAIAELSGLISNIGSLSAQAQSLPLTAPTLPGLPQSPGYQPQPTDYTQFGNDAN